MKHLLISRADGGLSIMPLTGELLALLDVMLEEYVVGPEIRQWEGVALPEWLPIKGWRVADESPPADRTFRDTWVDDGATIAHDMTKAREIWRDRMRDARAPLLAALDIEYMRALERGQATETIVGRKQGLRDAPADPAIEVASTPDELKAVWPAALKA